MLLEQNTYIETFSIPIIQVIYEDSVAVLLLG